MCANLCDLSYCDDVQARICFSNQDATSAEAIDATVKRLLQDCDVAPQPCLDSDADSFAYVVRLKSRPDDLYVVYRGTNSLEDLAKDVDVLLHPLSDAKAGPGPGPRVHSGFLGVYRDLEPSVAPCVDAFMQQGNPDARLVFTGFSMGAGVAAIAALTHARKYPARAAFVGLGMPRTGDRAWAAAFGSAVPGAIRVVSASDPVAKLPVGAGYSHVGTLLHVGHPDPHPDIAVPSALIDHKLVSYIANVLAYVAARSSPVPVPVPAAHAVADFFARLFARLFGERL